MPRARDKNGCQIMRHFRFDRHCVAICFCLSQALRSSIRIHCNNPSSSDHFRQTLPKIRIGLDIGEDTYATSVDYIPKTEMSQEFFATVQNKMHWATHGQTADCIPLPSSSSRRDAQLKATKLNPVQLSLPSSLSRRSK